MDHSRLQTHWLEHRRSSYARCLGYRPPPDHILRYNTVSTPGYEQRRAFNFVEILPVVHPSSNFCFLRLRRTSLRIDESVGTSGALRASALTSRASMRLALPRKRPMKSWFASSGMYRPQNPRCGRVSRSGFRPLARGTASTRMLFTRDNG